MSKNRQRFESAFSDGREFRKTVQKKIIKLQKAGMKENPKEILKETAKVVQKNINPRFRSVWYAGFISKAVSGKARKAIDRKRLALS